MIKILMFIGGVFVAFCLVVALLIKAFKIIAKGFFGVDFE